MARRPAQIANTISWISLDNKHRFKLATDFRYNRFYQSNTQNGDAEVSCVDDDTHQVVFGASGRVLPLGLCQGSAVGNFDQEGNPLGGELEREAEIERVFARRGAAAAEDLDADQADGRGDAPAIFDELVEGRIARALEVHFDAVDEIVERLARQGKLRHERLEVRALRRQRRVGPEYTAHFRPPVEHLRGLLVG